MTRRRVLLKPPLPPDSRARDTDATSRHGGQVEAVRGAARTVFGSARLLLQRPARPAPPVDVEAPPVQEAAPRARRGLGVRGVLAVVAVALLGCYSAAQHVRADSRRSCKECVGCAAGPEGNDTPQLVAIRRAKAFLRQPGGMDRFDLPRTRKKYQFYQSWSEDAWPYYPIATNHPRSKNTLPMLIDGYSFVVDASWSNLAMGYREEPEDRVQRLLAVCCYLREHGATGIIVLFDGNWVDQYAPKNDIRKTYVARGDDSKRGLWEHYETPRTRHRHRMGTDYRTVLGKEKQALDGIGVTWVHMTEAYEAELLAAYLTRSDDFDVDAMLGNDVKDFIHVGLGTTILDVRRPSKRIDDEDLFGYLVELEEVVRIFGLEYPSTLLVLQILWGDDDEAGYPQPLLSVRGGRPIRGSPLRTFLDRCLYLEELIDGDDYPDAISVLIGHLEGCVEFDDENDAFWEHWCGRDDHLDCDADAAERCYCHTVFRAYQLFAEGADRAGALLSDDDVAKIQNAELPFPDLSPEDAAEKIREIALEAPYNSPVTN